MLSWEVEQVDDDDGAGQATLQDAVTRSGRTASKPARFIEEIGAATGDYEIGLSMSEIRHHASMKEFPTGEFAPGEIVCMGAGLGGGFENTHELHVNETQEGHADQGCQGMGKGSRQRTQPLCRQ
jgi:hypothetical protein